MPQPRLLPPMRPRVAPDVSLAIVNIVLLLILFFLATGAMVNRATGPVTISATRELPIAQLPRPVLSLRGTELALDGTPVTAADLPARLAEALAERPASARRLHLVIDRDAPALELLGLLDQPGLAGLEVMLVTVHERSAPGAQP